MKKKGTDASEWTQPETHLITQLRKHVAGDLHHHGRRKPHLLKTLTEERFAKQG